MRVKSLPMRNFTDGSLTDRAAYGKPRSHRAIQGVSLEQDSGVVATFLMWRPGPKLKESQRRTAYRVQKEFSFPH